jgi:ribosome biogenesis GTPase
MQGIIIKTISNDYTVLVNNKTYLCKSRGKLKYDKIKPKVGDNVCIDDNNRITEILPRKNELIRPAIANIDQAYIITSLKQPSLDLNLLDKLLLIITYHKIKPIICFSKLDLLNELEKKEFFKIKEYYEKIGYQVFINNELDEIKKTFANKISVFTGQTGAGKSTLLNNISPLLSLKTNEISLALNRGKNTTTHVELLNICSGWVADSPGFSDIKIDFSKEEIEENIIEFRNYKKNCEYRDCTHSHEECCEVKRQVELGNILKSRYDNYLKFIKGDLWK